MRIPSHVSFIIPISDFTVNNIPVLGFTISVPLKQFQRQDTPSQAEIVFEGDTPYGDVYDHVCAHMDLNPNKAALGYKFEGDPKTSIIWLPPDDPAIFDTMLEKVKSHTKHAQTRAVILEIHDLVRYIHSHVLTVN